MASDNLITNFNDVQLPSNSNKPFSGFRNGSSTQEKTPVVFWGNVGVKRNGKLVSLPMGIMLDKSPAIKLPKPPAQNASPEQRERYEEFRNLQAARQQLWDKVQKIMSTLKPGETVELPFTFEIRRVAETEEVEVDTTTENPFAIGDLGFPGL